MESFCIAPSQTRESESQPRNSDRSSTFLHKPTALRHEVTGEWDWVLPFLPGWWNRWVAASGWTANSARAANFISRFARAYEEQSHAQQLPPKEKVSVPKIHDCIPLGDSELAMEFPCRYLLAALSLTARLVVTHG